MTMSEKDRIAAIDSITRDAPRLTEVVDAGDPFIVEFFHSNIEDNRELVESRLEEWVRESEIARRLGKYDEHLENSIKVITALLELREIDRRYNEFIKTGDLSEGYSVV